MASLSLIRLTACPQQLSSKFRQPLHQFPVRAPSVRIKVPITKISASSTPTPASDRLISAASYFFPLINGIQYGRFLLAQYPILAVPLKPIYPILSLYHSVPYATFVSFFALYLGVARNPTFSRYVRFNALQALVLDVLLAVPLLVQRILSPGQTGVGLKLTVWGYNALFVFLVACFVNGLVSSILGKTPYLPLVAEAAGRQIDS